MADNLLDKASILLTPTAYDNGSMLSVKPENGDGDFTFSRASAATRVNAQGLVENVQIISSELVSNGNFSQIGTEEVSNGNFSQEGSELVTNGDFSNGLTNWSLNGGSYATIVGGALNSNNTENGNWFAENISQNISFVNGKTYKVTFKAKNISGDLNLRLTQGANVIYSTNLTSSFVDYEVYYTANADNSSIRIFCNDLVGQFQIDNVSVKEVGQDWTLGAGWSIGEDKALFDGGSDSNLVSYTNVDNGKSYKYSFTISDMTNGALSFRLGSSSSNDLRITADGTYTGYALSDGTSIVFRAESGFDGSIDNVSVKEVGQDWTFGTGWSVEDGKATTDGTINSNCYQDAVTTIGQTYKYSFDVLDSGSGVIDGRFRNGGGIIQSFSSEGTYAGTFVAYNTLADFVTLSGNTASFSITNISVKEITDDTDLPRIDYTDGCGVWLLEPQSTNLVNNSELLNIYFSSKTDTTITDNYGTSPSGETNSSRIQFADDTSFCYSVISVSTDHTSSVFVKGISGETVRFGIGSSVVTGDLFTFNGLWQRIDFTTSSATQIFFSSYYGATTRDFEAFGLQLEALPYATSYIPTNGATNTRLQDIATNSGNSTLINSTEGVLYLETTVFESDVQNTISISNGTTSKRVFMGFGIVDNEIACSLTGGFPVRKTISNIKEFNKIAFAWGSFGAKLFINGVLEDSNTSVSSFVANDLTQIDFMDADGNPAFYGKTKALAVYKEALTDEQLQSLTTI